MIRTPFYCKIKEKGEVQMKVEKVKTREKIAYGIGDLGNNIAYGAVGFYFVFFLTDVAGLSPIWAGNIFMIVRLWNAFSDLIMGVTWLVQ